MPRSPGGCTCRCAQSRATSPRCCASTAWPIGRSWPRWRGRTQARRRRRAGWPGCRGRARRSSGGPASGPRCSPRWPSTGWSRWPGRAGWARRGWPWWWPRRPGRRSRSAAHSSTWCRPGTTRCRKRWPPRSAWPRGRSSRSRPRSPGGSPVAARCSCWTTASTWSTPWPGSSNACSPPARPSPCSPPAGSGSPCRGSGSWPSGRCRWGRTPSGSSPTARWPRSTPARRQTCAPASTVSRSPSSSRQPAAPRSARPACSPGSATTSGSSPVAGARPCGTGRCAR